MIPWLHDCIGRGNGVRHWDWDWLRCGFTMDHGRWLMMCCIRMVNDVDLQWNMTIEVSLLCLMDHKFGITVIASTICVFWFLHTSLEGRGGRRGFNFGVIGECHRSGERRPCGDLVGLTYILCVMEAGPDDICRPVAVVRR